MISDHDHVPGLSDYVEGRPRFRTGRCRVCGAWNDEHLSHGRLIASRVGGDPMDYVRIRSVPPEEGTP